MPEEYIAPTYQLLKESTEGLKKSYNALSSRYIPPQLDKLISDINGLEIVYKQKNVDRKTEPNQQRLDQIACISTLCNDLTQKLSTDNSQSVKAILIGAVLYRYLRLQADYTAPRRVPSFFKPLVSWVSNVENCLLLDLLKQLLGFDESNPIDERSKAVYLRAFQTYLTTDRYYERFPYIKNHLTYLPELNEDISIAEKASLPIKQQLDFIDFIQSIARALDEQDPLVVKTLHDLLKALKPAREALPEGGVLTLTEILPHMDALNPDVMTRHILVNLLGKNLKIASNGEFENEELDPDEPIDQVMPTLHLINNKYTLIGAYLLVSRQCTAGNRPFLSEAINLALSVNCSTPMDIETWKKSLLAFKRFMIRPENSRIKLDAWGPGGLACVEAELTKLESKLNSAPDSVVLSVDSFSSIPMVASSSSSSSSSYIPAPQLGMSTFSY